MDSPVVAVESGEVIAHTSEDDVGEARADPLVCEGAGAAWSR